MGSPAQMPLAPDQMSKLKQMFDLMRLSQPQQATAGPQLPQPTPAAPTLGGNNIKLTSGMASPAVPGIPYAKPGGGATPSHNEVFQGMPGSLMAIKAQMHSAKVEKYRQLTNQYIALQQDPNAQSARAKLAQGDPKIAKALEKQQQDFAKMTEKALADPNSAEAQGIQKAYQDQESRVAAQQSQQAAQLKLQQTVAEIRKNQAEAAQREKLTPQSEEERAVAMGTAPSADVKEQAAARRQVAMDNLNFRQDQLKQQYDLAQERMSDARVAEQDRAMYMQGMVDARNRQIDTQIELAKLRWEGKSKLPASLVGRVEQAKQLLMMIDDLTAKADDKDNQKYMGPVAGMAAGASRKFSKKFSDMYSEYGSFIAMQPIMHAYRGAAAVTKHFESVAGGFSQTPQAFKGGLEGLRNLPLNFVSDLQRDYPNDPIWKDFEGLRDYKPTTPDAQPLFEQHKGTENDPHVVR